MKVGMVWRRFDECDGRRTTNSNIIISILFHPCDTSKRGCSDYYVRTEEHMEIMANLFNWLGLTDTYNSFRMS